MKNQVKEIAKDVPEELLAKIEEAAVDNRISCSVARRVAAELDLPVRRAGDAADALGIKITACELGCF